MTIRTLARLALPTAALLALTGCGASAAAGPAPDPTTPVAAVESSPPTPDTPTPEVAAISVTTADLLLLDGDGDVLAAFDYFADADSAIEALTDLFGEPELLDLEPKANSDARVSASVRYEWPGLLLFDDTETPHSPDATNLSSSPDFSVQVRTASLEGIRFEGPDGAVVGGPVSEVDDAVVWNPDYADHETGAMTRTPLIDPIEVGVLDGNHLFLGVLASGPVDGAIDLIAAPVANFGI